MIAFYADTKAYSHQAHRISLMNKRLLAFILFPILGTLFFLAAFVILYVNAKLERMENKDIKICSLMERMSNSLDYDTSIIQIVCADGTIYLANERYNYCYHYYVLAFKKDGENLFMTAYLVQASRGNNKITPGRHSVRVVIEEEFERNGKILLGKGEALYYWLQEGNIHNILRYSF